MSLETPTTAEINANIIAQLEAALNQTIPLLPKSFLRVLAKVLAGVFIILYKYAGFIFLQLFVQTASAEETEVNGETITPLFQWGELIGVGLPTPATQAELLIDITVENQIGSLPSGTQFVGSINGVTYLLIGEVALDASVVQGTIRASADQGGGSGAGVIGNLDPGAIVTFANPIAFVARDAVVDSQVVTGADAEDTEAYRQRILDRFQKRPQGGAYADYELWGEEAAGIINVYPYTGSPGQVDVYSEATPASSGSPDGIPTVAQLNEVFDLIEFNENGLATRRPANAFVNSLPITRTDFDVEVSGLSVDNPAQVQSDIDAAVKEYFLSRAPFIAGLSIPPRNDRATSTGVGGVVDDIVSAANGTFIGVNVTQSAVPVGIYVLGEGEKVKSNDVTFI